MPPKSGRGRRASTRKSTPKKGSQAVPSDVAVPLESPSAIEAEEAPKDTDFKAQGVEDESSVQQSQSGAVLVSPPSETLIPAKEEQEEVGDDKNGGVADNNEKDNKAADNSGVSTAADENCNNNDNSGGTGNPKKVVKKIVKVVKKVIKKVPKKVPQTGAEIDENPGEITNPSSAIAAVEGEADETGNKPATACSDVQRHAENTNLIEKGEQKKDVSDTETCDVEKVEKGIESRQVDVKPEEEIGVAGECDNENKVEKEEEEDEEEEEDVAKEEKGGKLFRGELEAIERRKRRRTEIFIGGLDKDAKEEDVRKVFAEAGEIVDLKVVMNASTGKNKGFAFLRYASADDARRALEKFAKVEICGKQCGATPFEGNDTIYLGNIDKKWKDEDVAKLLQEIGIENIDKVTAMIDPNNSECNRGFAFVEFETNKDAQIALKKLQNKNVFGKNLNIKVAWAEPLKEIDEEEMVKVKTVYAEFIPSSWDEERVRDAFKKFGEIDNIVLARNLQTTKRKDFAFINYKTRDAAIKCIESFGQDIKDENENKVTVKVSLAKPMQKNKRQNPALTPVAKEVPRKKQKTTHSNLQPAELRNRAHPALLNYSNQITDRSSTNAELVQLLREQASWRPSHASLRTGPIGVNYSSSLPGGKRQLSMMEADPLRPDMSRYPYPRLDASFPVASSSRNVIPHARYGHPSSLLYQQQHSGYPSESLYGARYYPGYTEMRGRTHGSSNPYHRY